MSYKKIKYCKHCNQRFVIERGERDSWYCEACTKKIQKSEE